MKLIHTADWHLGHKLHEVDREDEQRAFLGWLVGTLHDEQADALLICGDIFDSANPSARAQKLWYGFLARCREKLPKLEIIVIGGNHDSAGRLNAPNPLLEELNVQIVGGLPRTGRDAELEAMVKAIRDNTGKPLAWVAAVPFLRTPDLPRLSQEDNADTDPMIAGVKELYGRVINHIKDNNKENLPIIGMGHLYLTGTSLSDLSERKIFGGNQHAIPASIFSDDLDYLALGHLHLAQEAGGSHIRYSGSPIPLSMTERHYKHQVLRLCFNDTGLSSLEGIAVPRIRAIVRIPDRGELPLNELIQKLQELPELAAGETEGAHGYPPLLEVAVRLDKPEPGLRHMIDEALEGKNAQLVTISRLLTGHGKSLADQEPTRGLAEMKAEDVFYKAWQKKFEELPSDEIKGAFFELLAHVQNGGSQ